MTENELVDSLRHLDPANRAAKDALAKNVIRDSRAPAVWLVAHMDDRDPAVAANARSILEYVEELAATPLLDAPEPAGPLDRVNRIMTVVDGQLELRDKTVERLEKMLDDKTLVPYTIDPKVEEKPAPRRVCDEAYILLRKLLNATEDPDEQMNNNRFFLFLSDERKDAEIRKVKDSKTFSDVTLPE